MPSKTKDSRSVIAAHTDSIRIVPLHVPETLVAPAAGIAPAPPPELTYRGGVLLSAEKGKGSERGHRKGSGMTKGMERGQCLLLLAHDH